MSDGTKCPKCGSVVQAPSKSQSGGWHYDCGTVVASNGNVRFRSHECASRGLAALRTTIAEQEEENRILEQEVVMRDDRVNELQDKLAEREKFKAYVHQRLDEAGVPAEVSESEHTKAGCRIGGRLDWLFEQLKRAEGERDAVASQYNAFRNTVDEWSERVEGKLDKALPGIRDLDAKLAAAERENERLREGIVWLECDIRTADIANAIGDHERWESHAAALLSPPTTQGEEVRDG